MSRSQYLVPLFVLPLCFACSASSPNPPASADDANKTDATASSTDEPSDSAKEESKAKESESTQADAAKPEEKKADDVKEKTSSKSEDEGEEIVDSSRPKEVCEKILKDAKPSMKEKCYEPVHKEKRDVKGVVHLFVKLDAAGKVTESHVGGQTTINEPKIHDCMVEIAKTLKFPASSKGLEKEVSYQYGFNNITVTATNNPKK